MDEFGLVWLIRFGMDEFGLVQLSSVWYDEVDFLKCSRSASQLSFTNLLHNKYISVQELRSTGKLFRSLMIKVKEKI